MISLDFGSFLSGVCLVKKALIGLFCVAAQRRKGQSRFFFPLSAFFWLFYDWSTAFFFYSSLGRQGAKKGRNNRVFVCGLFYTYFVLSLDFDNRRWHFPKLTEQNETNFLLCFLISRILKGVFCIWNTLYYKRAEYCLYLFCKTRKLTFTKRSQATQSEVRNLIFWETSFMSFYPNQN